MEAKAWAVIQVLSLPEIPLCPSQTVSSRLFVTGCLFLASYILNICVECILTATFLQGPLTVRNVPLPQPSFLSLSLWCRSIFFVILLAVLGAANVPDPGISDLCAISQHHLSIELKPEHPCLAFPALLCLIACCCFPTSPIHSWPWCPTVSHCTFLSALYQHSLGSSLPDLLQEGGLVLGTLFLQRVRKDALMSVILSPGDRITFILLEAAAGFQTPHLWAQYCYMPLVPCTRLKGAARLLQGGREDITGLLW